jgi:hypothetical protein
MAHTVFGLQQSAVRAIIPLASLDSIFYMVQGFLEALP